MPPRARMASATLVAKKIAANTAVTRARKLPAPLLPKTVWEAPAPKEAPASAPLPCCNRTKPINPKATRICTARIIVSTCSYPL